MDIQNKVFFCVAFNLSPYVGSLRRLEEVQCQLAEEKNKVALSNEQREQDLSRKDRELCETRDSHGAQIKALQEKIAALVRWHIYILEIFRENAFVLGFFLYIAFILNSIFSAAYVHS